MTGASEFVPAICLFLEVPVLDLHCTQDLHQWAGADLQRMARV